MLLVVLQIDQNDVRPIPESEQIDQHRQTVKDVTDSEPDFGLVINGDLDAL